MKKSYIVAIALCLFIFAGILLWEKIFPTQTSCVAVPVAEAPASEQKQNEADNAASLESTEAVPAQSEPAEESAAPVVEGIVIAEEEPAPVAPSIPELPDIIYEIVNLDKRPEPIHQPQPKFPPEAREQGKSGFVFLYFIVRRDGSVTDEKVEQSSDPIFENAALETIKEWRFNPGIRGGVPVSVKVQFPLIFNIEETQ